MHSHVAGTISNQQTKQTNVDTLTQQLNRELAILPRHSTLTLTSPSTDPVTPDRLVGLVLKASVSTPDDSRFESQLARGYFSASSHTSDLNIGTRVAILPGARRYRVRAGTGRPDGNILRLVYVSNEQLLALFVGCLTS